MFPQRFLSGLARRRAEWSRSLARRGWPAPSASWLARAGVALVVLMGLADGASAQALGTMQVSARVLPGRPGWAALAEARALAQGVLAQPAVTHLTRRRGLVQARAEVALAAGRRRLLVTIQHPHN